MIGHIIYSVSMLVQIMSGIFMWHSICKARWSFAFTLLTYFGALELGYIVFTFGLKNYVVDDLHTAYKMLLGVAAIFIYYKDTIVKKVVVMSYTLGTTFLVGGAGTRVVKAQFNLNDETFMEMFSSVDGMIHFGTMICADMLMIVYTLTVIICKWKNMKATKNLRFIFIMLAFTVIHTASLIVYYSDATVLENDNNSIIQIVYQALLFILIFAQYYSTLHSQRLIETEASLRQLESEMQHTYDYYALADRKFSDISSLRHDMQNQLQTVRMLMADRSGIEAARETLGEIQEKLASARAVQFCESPIVNSLLTLKLDEIRDENIETSIVLRGCEKLSLDNYDMCSLFSNLFDNACEACKALPEGSERFIELKSGVVNGRFVLKLRNSCKVQEKTKKFGLPETTKSEAGHGFGTKIIDSIAKKYDGVFTMKYENGVMESVVIMKVYAT